MRGLRHSADLIIYVQVDDLEVLLSQQIKKMTTIVVGDVGVDDDDDCRRIPNQDPGQQGINAVRIAHGLGWLAHRS